MPACSPVGFQQYLAPLAPLGAKHLEKMRVLARRALTLVLLLAAAAGRAIQPNWPHTETFTHVRQYFLGATP